MLEGYILTWEANQKGIEKNQIHSIMSIFVKEMHNNFAPTLLASFPICPSQVS